MNIEECMDALVDALKEEEVYINYQKALADLNEHQPLLLSYQQTKEEYLKMRPYFAYQDFSELKQRTQQLADQVMGLPAYQAYLSATSALSSRVEEISQQIFEMINEETE